MRGRHLQNTRNLPLNARLVGEVCMGTRLAHAMHVYQAVFSQEIRPGIEARIWLAF